MSSKEECKQFESMLKVVAESYQFIDLWTSSLTCENSNTSRKQTLDQFQSHEQPGRFFILNSVRILDEAVDVPSCDCVFISNVTDYSSDIRTVQRLMRGSRLDTQNLYRHNRAIMKNESIKQKYKNFFENPQYSKYFINKK